MTERRDRAPRVPRESIVPIYRVYTFEHNRHIAARAEIDCANDEDATDKAKQLLDGHDIEVWEKDRFVAFFKSKE